jgi:hypothetical protein
MIPGLNSLSNPHGGEIREYMLVGSTFKTFNNPFGPPILRISLCFFGVGSRPTEGVVPGLIFLSNPEADAATLVNPSTRRTFASSGFSLNPAFLCLSRFLFGIGAGFGFGIGFEADRDNGEGERNPFCFNSSQTLIASFSSIEPAAQ